MSEVKEIPEILADRLNVEPVVLRGLSNSELVMVIKVAFGFWLPVCLIVAGLFGNFSMGLGMSLVLILLTVLLSGTLLQKIKRGRPRFYYQHQLAFAMNKYVHKKTLDDKSRVIKHSGQWSLGRSR